jgi:6-phosphofructokinase 1
MGRECPDIAEYCAIATNASLLIAKKEDYDLDKIISKIKLELKSGEEAPLIVLRENILDANDLAKKLQNKFDIETRACILGYVQRGTSPSVYDRIYAKQLASFTIDLIKKEKYGLAVGIINNKIISSSILTALSENNRTIGDLTKFI